VHEDLGRSKRSQAVQRQSYIQLKGREAEVSLQIASLAARVEFKKRGFKNWSKQIREEGTVADSLARERSNLENEVEVYQTTFTRFAKLEEEARITRQQAAGAIQIVARAVVARPVARGTLRKAAISAFVGLMGSVILAFLLEYVARSRARVSGAG